MDIPANPARIAFRRRNIHGRLFTQPTGQSKLELFAESDTKFFLKEVDAQVEFQKGTDGAVTGLVLHQGGQDLPGKKK